MRWTEVGKVTELRTYPVKGFAGISHNALAIDAMGPVGDRRYMLVDDAGKFVTQRALPQLATLQAKVSANRLTLVTDNQQTLPVDFGSSPQPARVWQDDVSVVEAIPAVNDWLSERLGCAVRLVKLADGAKRIRHGSARPEPFAVSFADGYPFLLTSESSLTALNRNLSQPVALERFRANIVVSGAPEFAEENWQQVKVGDVVFPATKKCQRCQVITIDQNFGTPSSKEPLQVIPQITPQGELTFGINLIHETVGHLQLGDTVWAVA